MKCLVAKMSELLGEFYIYESSTVLTQLSQKKNNFLKQMKRLASGHQTFKDKNINLNKK
jgi:hypothetical protein